VAQHPAHQLERHARGVPAAGARVLRSFVHPHLHADLLGCPVPLLAQGVRDPAALLVAARRVGEEGRGRRPFGAAEPNGLAPLVQAPLDPAEELAVDRNPGGLARLCAADRSRRVGALHGAPDAKARDALAVLDVAYVERPNLAGSNPVAGREESATPLDGNRIQDGLLARLGEDRGSMIDDRDHRKRGNPIDQIQAVQPRHEGTEVSEDIADRLGAEPSFARQPTSPVREALGVDLIDRRVGPPREGTLFPSAPPQLAQMVRADLQS